VEVSRFMATCCAADAVPYSVQVTPPAGALDFKTNQWVLVRGTVTDDPKRTFVVTADKIEAADRPSTRTAEFRRCSQSNVAVGAARSRSRRQRLL
jgi:uncharacterized membrane protein YcgQ (UPF0703/DUF1980 family)